MHEYLSVSTLTAQAEIHCALSQIHIPPVRNPEILMLGEQAEHTLSINAQLSINAMH